MVSKIRLHYDRMTLLVTCCVRAVLVVWCLLFDTVHSATTTVSSGYYVLTVFGDSSCTGTIKSQQTFALNQCYASSSTSTGGQYEIALLTLESTTNAFTSFAIQDSPSLSACSAYLTTTTYQPTTTTALETCTLAGTTNFYYTSQWSAATPPSVPFNSPANSTLSSGAVVATYDTGCAGTPRTGAFFATGAKCVPYPLTGATVTSYVTAVCGTTTLPVKAKTVVVSAYSNAACTGAVVTKTATSGTTCQVRRWGENILGRRGWIGTVDR